MEVTEQSLKADFPHGAQLSRGSDVLPVVPLIDMAVRTEGDGTLSLGGWASEERFVTISVLSAERVAPGRWMVIEQFSTGDDDEGTRVAWLNALTKERAKTLSAGWF